MPTTTLNFVQEINTFFLIARRQWRSQVGALGDLQSGTSAAQLFMLYELAPAAAGASAINLDDG